MSLKKLGQLNRVLERMDQSNNVHMRWNKHHTTLVSVFDALLDNEKLTDCTISAEGQHLQAHKIILSACSPVLEELFGDNFEKHPIIILPDVKYNTVKAVINFMYRGEVDVSQEELSAVLKLSESLQIRGLSDSGCMDNVKKQKCSGNNTPLPHPETLPYQPSFVSCSSSNQNGPEEKMQSFRESPPNVSSNEEDSVRIDTIPKLSQKYRKSMNQSGSDKRAGQSTLRDVFTPEFGGVHQLPSEREALHKRHNVSGELVYSSILHWSAGSQLLNTSGETGAAENQQVLMPEEVMPDKNSTNMSAHRQPVSQETKAKVLMNQMEIVEEITLDDSNDYHGSHDYDYDDSKSAQKDFGKFKRVNEGLEYEENFFMQENENLCLPLSSDHLNNMTVTASQTVLHKQFSCRSCGKCYQYLRGLQRHKKYECAKKPLFQCPHCSYRCARNDNLKAHMASRRCQMQKKYEPYQQDV